MKEQKKSPWHVLGNLDLYFMVILLACLIVLTVVGVLKRYILLLHKLFCPYLLLIHYPSRLECKTELSEQLRPIVQVSLYRPA